ncbi:C3HC4 type (RING finger) zinc finger protein (macronuclear) [Tetrahymena thermophila SB210]|uniref:C3HC4 type (RING finger) zinc finger protein n=1 Tax=Tetrahymena thermophila (strain SB210) TaxID=312017 RepID=I7MI46_TETTS|nr:C3HC4 type (RING finger) zinc finger protein [Tetrahymena thermophila SB210]EAS03886.1 C3HC4 type (RING finger) zinc finger protein [Tetrahymena thermophila SB210]|eukprot:XP_001024131.1 C3HC4 type (RING finger) zinc finger protein [Tetrahymena thermophila SB210]
MKSNILLNKLILISIFLSIHVCQEHGNLNIDIKTKQSPQIYPLKENELGGNTSTWNKTYVFQGMMINKNADKEVILELEIETPISSHNSIVFGLKKDSALYYNNETDTYNALQIDVRGYYMRKQFYRIEYQFKEDIGESDLIYVTIYQNTLNPQDLKYSLKMISTDQEAQKRCPFNCLNRGRCDYQQGRCLCFSGYVDYDCSKPSNFVMMQNQQYSENIQETMLINLEFDSNSLRNGKFYHIYNNQLDGFFYIQLSLTQESKQKLMNENNQQKSLEFYYTLDKQNLQGIGVADKKFAQLSKKIMLEEFLNSDDAIEIFLEEFHAQQKQIISEFGNQDQQMLLFGFRLNESGLINNQEPIKFHIKFVLKENINIANQSINFLNFFKENQVVSILLILLIILILILFSLIIFIKRNSLIIQQSQQQYQAAQLEKKLKKEEEFQKVFDLIYHFIFNEESKKKHWPHLFNQSQESIQNTNSEQPSCSICLCEFELEDEVRLTYCTHFFHSDCLKQWLKKQKNCPNCRNDLTEPCLQEKKKSPATFLRQIFRNRLGSIDKKNKKGYQQQIDEFGLNLQPTSSIPTHQVEKMETNNNKIIQTINLNQFTNFKYKSSENFYKQSQQNQKKRLYLKQNSIKHNSMTEIDEIENKDKFNDSIKYPSRKYLRQSSIESPQPVALSKFKLSVNLEMQKSKMNQQN